MASASSSIFGGIFKKLQQKELILPYFEAQLLADKWPESYNIKIDSAPYYGAGDGYFHPSTHSLMGARQLYYMFHPDTRDRIIKERKTLQSHLTLGMGSALHGVIQTQMQMAGLVREENIEFEYVNEEHHARGRIDFIVDHPNGQTIPVELKTVNSYSFNKLEEIKPSWDAQLSMGLDNFGADFGILLALESGWPYKMREFRVPRNDKLLSDIYAKFDYVRECIALNKPPKYCCSFDSPEMKKCAARALCWLSEDNNV